MNAKVRNKTGLIMATAEGWLNVVQTLLEFNASVNETVHVVTGTMSCI